MKSRRSIAAGIAGIAWIFCAQTFSSNKGDLPACTTAQLTAGSCVKAKKGRRALRTEDSRLVEYNGTHWDVVYAGAESINVKDFGAVGDGVTDATTQLQAAITAARGDGASGTGRTVLVPAGIYLISNTLHVGNGVRFIGESGREGSTLLASATFPVPDVPMMQTGDDFWGSTAATHGAIIEYLRLDANNRAQMAWKTQRANEPSAFRNMNVINLTKYGLWIDNPVSGIVANGYTIENVELFFLTDSPAAGDSGIFINGLFTCCQPRVLSGVSIISAGGAAGGSTAVDLRGFTNAKIDRIHAEGWDICVNAGTLSYSLFENIGCGPNGNTAIYFPGTNGGGNTVIDTNGSVNALNDDLFGYVVGAPGLMPFYSQGSGAVGTASYLRLHDGGVSRLSGLDVPGTLGIPIGAAPAATCRPGQVFIDTDETVDTNCTTALDNSLCCCSATDTWVECGN